MNASEIVIHEIERKRVFVVRKLLTESIRKARESAHAHSHAQVLAFGVPRGEKKNHRPRFFSKFIRKYIYEPLANSNGAILEQIDAEGRASLSLLHSFVIVFAERTRQNHSKPCHT